jgi:putative ABC transport system substrate-binding protein
MMSGLACYIFCALLCVNSYPVEAQESKTISRLGFLSANSAQNDRDRLAVFREALRELGYLEAKNILIEYRFADGKFDRLPELAAGLTRLNVNIIVTAGNEAVQAAKNATQTIPIIMAFSGDPVRVGFGPLLLQGYSSRLLFRARPIHGKDRFCRCRQSRYLL